MSVFGGNLQSSASLGSAGTSSDELLLREIHDLEWDLLAFPRTSSGLRKPGSVSSLLSLATSPSCSEASSRTHFTDTDSAIFRQLNAVRPQTSQPHRPLRAGQPPVDRRMRPATTQGRRLTPLLYHKAADPTGDESKTRLFSPSDVSFLEMNERKELVLQERAQWIALGAWHLQLAPQSPSTDWSEGGFMERRDIDSEFDAQSRPPTSPSPEFSPTERREEGDPGEVEPVDGGRLNTPPGSAPPTESATQRIGTPSSGGRKGSVDEAMLQLCASEQRDLMESEEFDRALYTRQENQSRKWMNEQHMSMVINKVAVLQRAYRTYRCRREVIGRRRERLRDARRREARETIQHACCLCQKVFRGWRGRSVASARRVVIQEEKLYYMEARTEQEAISLNERLARRMVKADEEVYRRRVEDYINIARYGAGGMQHGTSKLDLSRQYRAAEVIQRSYRGHSAKRRREVMSMKCSEDLTRYEQRQLSGFRYNEAVSRIQAEFRDYRRRKALRMLESIQDEVGFLVKRELLRRKELVRNEVTSREELRERQQEEEQATLLAIYSKGLNPAGVIAEPVVRSDQPHDPGLKVDVGIDYGPGVSKRDVEGFEHEEVIDLFALEAQCRAYMHEQQSGMWNRLLQFEVEDQAAAEASAEEREQAAITQINRKFIAFARSDLPIADESLLDEAFITDRYLRVKEEDTEVELGLRSRQLQSRETAKRMDLVGEGHHLLATILFEERASRARMTVPEPPERCPSAHPSPRNPSEPKDQSGD